MAEQPDYITSQPRNVNSLGGPVLVGPKYEQLYDAVIWCVIINQYPWIAILVYNDSLELIMYINACNVYLRKSINCVQLLCYMAGWRSSYMVMIRI